MTNMIIWDKTINSGMGLTVEQGRGLRNTYTLHIYDEHIDILVNLSDEYSYLDAKRIWCPNDRELAYNICNLLEDWFVKNYGLKPIVLNIELDIDTNYKPVG